MSDEGQKPEFRINAGHIFAVFIAILALYVTSAALQDPKMRALDGLFPKK